MPQLTTSKTCLTISFVNFMLQVLNHILHALELLQVTPTFFRQFFVLRSRVRVFRRQFLAFLQRLLKHNTQHAILLLNIINFINVVYKTLKSFNWSLCLHSTDSFALAKDFIHLNYSNCRIHWFFTVLVYLHWKYAQKATSTLHSRKSFRTFLHCVTYSFS